MNEERNTRIETYLLGRMSATERSQFEQELAQDTSLANALREQEMVHDVMETMVEMDLFQKMKTWRAEADNVVPMNTKKEAKVIPFYRRFSTLAVAASFLLLVSAVFWLLQMDTNPASQPSIAQTEVPATTPLPTVETTTENPVAIEEEVTPTTPPANGNVEKEIPKETPKTTTPSSPTTDYLALADDYANPLQMGTIRSGETNDDLMAQALDDLQNGRISQGIEKLKIIIADEPANSDAQYYLGLAYYQLENYAAAIAPLLKVSKDAFYLETEKAQWYLVLAYMQNGQKGLAKTALKELVNDTEHSYHAPAMKLQARM